MKAKKHRFFKVAFDADIATIFDYKTPITLKESCERSTKFYGKEPRFCVSLSPTNVIDSLKLGLILMEMSLNHKAGFIIRQVLDTKIPPLDLD